MTSDNGGSCDPEQCPHVTAVDVRGLCPDCLHDRVHAELWLACETSI